MKIGFIGLGLMGSRMVENLSSAGYEINLYNRTKEKLKAFNRPGFKIKDTPQAVGATSDILITMLSTPEAVQQVALGENGFLPALGKGSVWIDCSTVNPSFSKEMAEITIALGSNFLDAPVAGSVGPAASGELVFMIGGKKSIVKYCDPLFKIMGKKAVHVGENGMGSALKMVNNLIMGLSMYAFTEGLLLGEGLGLKREAIFSFLEGSPVVAPMAMMKKNKIEKNDFSPEFPLQWLHKDLQLASISAYEKGVALPGTNAIKEIFSLAKQSGLGEKDFTAIISFLNTLNPNHHEV